MQRWTALVFVVLVAATIAFVVLRAGAGKAVATVHSAGVGSASGQSASGQPAVGSPGSTPGGNTPGSAGDVQRLSAPRLRDDLDAGLDLDLPAVEPAVIDAGGQTLPNGQPAPGLPAASPRSVTFGAVLVEYRGAEGAGPGARSKEDALALAKQLASLGKTDFKAAVAQGDKGSGEDFGSIPHNVLEPGPEFVLFGLPVGEVSEPVDSPRGFYVFKRIE